MYSTVVAMYHSTGSCTPSVTSENRARYNNNMIPLLRIFSKVQLRALLRGSAEIEPVVSKRVV